MNPVASFRKWLNRFFWSYDWPEDNGITYKYLLFEGYFNTYLLLKVKQK
jgi:hypothetical protein